MRHLDEGIIHGWLDGAVDPDEVQRVEQHIAACGPCAARVAEARGLIAASSRILGALDAVPRGVVPQAGDAGEQAGGQRGGGAGAPAIRPGGTRHALGGHPPGPESTRRADRQRSGWVGRRLFAATGVRAAAAVVLLAAGGAVVLQVARHGKRAEFSAAGTTTEANARREITTAAPGKPAVARVVADTAGIAAPARETSLSRETPMPLAAGAPTAESAASVEPRRQNATEGRMRAAAEPARRQAKGGAPALLQRRREAASADRAEALSLSDVAATAGSLPPAVTPPLREVDGLRLLSDSLRRRNGRLVRRTVYEVRPGVRVVLEAERTPELMVDTFGMQRGRGAEQTTRRRSERDDPPRDDTAATMRFDSGAAVQQAAPPRSVSTSAAPASREADLLAGQSIQWTDEMGTVFTLSGPLSEEELQAIRRQIRPYELPD